MIIDSHCHLDYTILYNELKQVLERAKINKVKYFLTISTTLDSFEKIKLIIKNYDNVYGTLGIHPHETKNFTKINSDLLVNLKNNNKKIIGIGETGLDYYYNNSDKKIQKKIFIEHIKSAIELDLPLIIHSRNAEKDTFDILNEEKKNSNLKILMHCFAGSMEFSKKLLDLDSYISFSGIITFKNSGDLSKIVQSVPLNRILVETDSPYLAPEPFRGKSNEPSFIKYTIDKIAQIKNLSSEVISKETSNNFLHLFSLN
jgi:TatD DNase family protein